MVAQLRHEQSLGLPAGMVTLSVRDGNEAVTLALRGLATLCRQPTTATGSHLMWNVQAA
jgi:hypothetical protein